MVHIINGVVCRTQQNGQLFRLMFGNFEFPKDFNTEADALEQAPTLLSKALAEPGLLLGDSSLLPTLTGPIETELSHFVTSMDGIVSPKSYDQLKHAMKHFIAALPVQVLSTPDKQYHSEAIQGSRRCAAHDCAALAIHAAAAFPTIYQVAHLERALFRLYECVHDHSQEP